jgi:hypothetical protein
MHGASLSAEGRVLLQWLRDRMVQCGDNQAAYALMLAPATAAETLLVKFKYAAGKSFDWQGDVTTGAAVFRADFGSGRTELHAAVSLLAPENALSEAMFF